jgi:hypothetical protein
MPGERSRYGLMLSALGAIVLAVSVFLPWYGVSFTANGVLVVQNVGDQVATQFGLAGQEFTAVSAHQVLKDLNVILLVLAGLALLDALVPLARPDARVPEGAGASVVLVGSVASVCVLYRMVVPPTPAGGLVALSLREGAWLAMLGSLLMVGASLWPRFFRARSGGEARVKSTWSGLSGWTPEP